MLNLENKGIKIDFKQIRNFCESNHILKLHLFGSILREDFSEDSDIDVLVQFNPEKIPGLFAIARMERELSVILLGRKVDLRTAEDLSKYFRQDVLTEAEPIYVG